MRRTRAVLSQELFLLLAQGHGSQVQPHHFGVGLAARRPRRAGLVPSRRRLAALRARPAAARVVLLRPLLRLLLGRSPGRRLCGQVAVGQKAVAAVAPWLLPLLRVLRLLGRLHVGEEGGALRLLLRLLRRPGPRGRRRRPPRARAPRRPHRLPHRAKAARAGALRGRDGDAAGLCSRRRRAPSRCSCSRQVAVRRGPARRAAQLAERPRPLAAAHGPQPRLLPARRPRRRLLRLLLLRGAVGGRAGRCLLRPAGAREARLRAQQVPAGLWLSARRPVWPRPSVTGL